MTLVLRSMTYRLVSDSTELVFNTVWQPSQSLSGALCPCADGAAPVRLHDLIAFQPMRVPRLVITVGSSSNVFVGS